MRKLKPDARGSILCFVGPPGVGKTSLGTSIARALGRKFERISVGGVRDEAEIRGHRRTYIGAMPGHDHPRAARRRLATTRCSCSTRSTRWAPTSAATRPARCSRCSTPSRTRRFRDHYLDLPFDLSHVMFITTANMLDPIPAPLRDRMEVIQLAGYTEEEKLEIAKRYLVPRQIERNGLTPAQIAITDEALRRDHRRVHARGRRAQPRARARRDLPQGRARRSPRAGRKRQGDDRPTKRVRELLGQARASSPRRGGARASRASRPAWPGRRSAARCCSSRRPRCRARAS